MYVETDYYQLNDLKNQIREELDKRSEISSQEERVTEKTQKVIDAYETNTYLSQGWKFIGSFAENETYGCMASGVMMETSYRNSACVSCGQSMLPEKFEKFHRHIFKPMKVVICNDKGTNISRLPITTNRNTATASSINMLPIESVLDSAAPLTFDHSFG